MANLSGVTPVCRGCGERIRARTVVRRRSDDVPGWYTCPHCGASLDDQNGV